MANLNRYTTIKILCNENLAEYKQETTIHGLKYLAGGKRPLVERIIWILIFVISMTCLGYFIYKICNTWLEYQFMIIDNKTPNYLFDVPFAAITVCPAIKAKRDKFNIMDIREQITNHPTKSYTFWKTDYGRKYIMATQICRPTFGAYAKAVLTNISAAVGHILLFTSMEKGWMDRLQDMSPTREEVMESCVISNFKTKQLWKLFKPQTDCPNLFSPIITNEGICFTYNTIPDVLRRDVVHKEFSYYNITRERLGWDPDNGYNQSTVYPFNANVKGSPYGPNGLKLSLVANLSDTSSLCQPVNLGYKLYIHSPAVYPNTYEKYVSLEYGKEYTISLNPKTISTPNNLRSFKPAQRQCVFNNERRLKYFTFYNEINCQLECYRNFSATRLCNGKVPFSSPTEHNFTTCNQPSEQIGWHAPRFFMLLSAYYTKYKLDGLPEVEIKCDCLPECNSLNYEYKVERTNEANEMNVGMARTTVEIVFNEATFIGQKRVQRYTFETMISDFGGLLGLFLGGSILSLFEFLYFFTIRAFCTFKMKR